MANIEYRRISKPIPKGTFDCGVSDINDFVINSYAEDVAQAAYAYCIIAEGVEVGYYQLFFKEIELDYLPEGLSEYMMPFEDSVSAVHVYYVALEKQYQRHQIGTAVVKGIIESVAVLNKNWPVRIISIDALPHLVEWYKKLGFTQMMKTRDGQKTIAMYLDCANADDIKVELDRLADLES